MTVHFIKQVFSNTTPIYWEKLDSFDNSYLIEFSIQKEKFLFLEELFKKEKKYNVFCNRLKIFKENCFFDNNVFKHSVKFIFSGKGIFYYTKAKWSIFSFDADILIYFVEDSFKFCDMSPLDFNARINYYRQVVDKKIYPEIFAFKHFMFAKANAGTPFFALNSEKTPIQLVLHDIKLCDTFINLCEIHNLNKR